MVCLPLQTKAVFLLLALVSVTGIPGTDHWTLPFRTSARGWCHREFRCCISLRCSEARLNQHRRTCNPKTSECYSTQ